MVTAKEDNNIIMQPDKIKQLDGIVQQMTADGRKPEEIQMVVDDFKGMYSKGNMVQPQAAEPEGSWYGKIGSAIASPVSKSISTVAFAGEKAYNMATKGSEEANRLRDERVKSGGFDLNPMMPGKTNAIGSGAYKNYREGEIGGGEFVGRAGADFVGTQLEIGSYALAPLKAGMGFWGATKGALKAGSVMGAGEAGQEIGKEDTTLADAGIEGLKTGIGGAAAFGLLNVGSQFMRNYGAKALQSQAVMASSRAVKDLAESANTVLGDAFKGGASMADDFTNRSLSRAYNSLKNQFNTTWKKATNDVIDSVIPQTAQPELAQNAFHRSLSKTMGTLFRGSDDAYGIVKQSETPISSFRIAASALKDHGNAVKVNQFAPGTAEYKKSAQDMLSGKSSGSEVLDSFAIEMKPELSNPQTLGSIMDMWERAMAYLPHANNAEKKVIRDFANGLYDDAAEGLKKSDPQLLDQWNIAWEQWGSASKIWDSSILQKLRAPGTTDAIVDDIIKGKISPNEQDIIDSVLGNPETSEGFTDVIIGSVLRKVKNDPLGTGDATIEKFLQRWGKHLSPEQIQMMDNLGAFSSGTFDEFLGGIGKMKGLDDEGIRGLQGLSGDTSQQLFDQSGKLDLGKFIEKGDFGGIADGMYSLLKKSPKDVEAVIGKMTAEEKQVVGLSMTRRMYDEGMEVMTKKADGSFDVKKAMVDATVKTWDDVSKAIQKSGDDTLYDMFDAGQLESMRLASQMATNFNNVNDMPVGAAKRLLDAIMTGIYAKYGQIGSAARTGVQVFKPNTVSKVDYMKSIDELIDSGLLEKNGRIIVSDLINLAKTGVPATNAVVNEDEDKI